MKNKINKKLLSYSASATVVLLSSETKAQQFFYHDFNPDVVLDTIAGAQFFNLDMNNDSQIDFTFVQVNTMYLGQGIRYAVVANYSGNNAEIGSTGAIGTNPVGYPFPLNFGDTISYNNPQFENVQNNVIGGSIEFYSVGAIGNFNGKDKYMGVKFFGPTEIGIGWIRCELDSQVNHLILKDYAYTTDTESPILAGQMFPNSVPLISENEFGVKYFYANQILSLNLMNVNEAEAVVTNVNGQIVAETKLQRGKNQIQLEGVAAGVYFISVTTETQTENGKFLIR